MRDSLKKLAWFMANWAMSVIAILIVGYGIRWVIA